jgi:hypothetical protein
VSKRVPVGLSYGDEAFVSLVFGAVGAAGLGAAAFAAGSPWWGAGALGVAALCAVPAVLRYDHVRKNRRWLAATAGGFEFTDYRGRVTVPDAEVTDVAVVEKSVYLGGPAPVRRRRVRFAFDAGEGERAFTFTQLLAPGAADPLGPALERALADLADRTAQGLRRGRELSGDGWVLTRTGLTAADPAGGRTVVPLADVSAVDVVDHAVCVWARGADAPVFRRPLSSAGASVLRRVLPGLLADRPAADPAPAGAGPEPAGGFGRVIFSREGGRRGEEFRIAVALVVMAVLLGSLAVWYAAAEWWETPGARAAALVGPALLLGAGWGAVAVWAGRRDVFRCHERGIVHATWRGTTALEYRDLGAFTYSGTRRFVDGMYMGTDVDLRFDPLRPEAGPGVRYRATVQFDDKELDGLRDFVSRALAGHMLARLRAGQDVPWTPQLALTPGGLAVRRAGKADAGPARVVRYDQVGAHEFKDGVFRLHTAGDYGRPVTERVSERNFFPGYYLLLLLTAPAGEEG